jgi:transcriptional regulator with XRE-family HTH domain
MEELRRLRKARGLSQAKLAVLAGLDPSTVSQIETGARRANTRTLEKLAAVLGADLADLFPKGQAPLLPEPSEEQKAAHNFAGQWIEYLNGTAEHWGKQIADPDLELDDALELSTLSFNLAMLYLMEEDLVRAWCDPEKESALDAAEERIEQIGELINRRVDEKVRERNLELQAIPDLTKIRKQREQIADLKQLRANA